MSVTVSRTLAAMSVVSSYRSSTSGLSSLPPPRALALDRRQLQALPEDLEGRIEREAITELSLAGNQLCPLPREIGRFRRLQKLDISANSLGALPAELCQLDSLTVLVAKKNALKGLPKEFVRLVRLTELNLSGNQLEEIPAPVLALRGLEVLHLGGNRLQTVSPAIGQLTR